MPTSQLKARFSLLATFIAARPMDVAEALAGESAHTDGQVIFVSADGSIAEQRQEVLVQSALLGAGSLDQRLVRTLRARPSVARRYLTLEGRRVLAELSARLPLAAQACPSEQSSTATADESLEVARGRAWLADPPKWFGVIRPFRLSASVTGPGEENVANQRPPWRFDPANVPENDEDDEDGPSRHKTKSASLDNPPFDSRAPMDFIRKLFGRSRTSTSGASGAFMQERLVRQIQAVGAKGRPMPIPIQFADIDSGAARGVRGTLYPEWDVHNDRYRPEWCRVIDYPLTTAADVSAAAVSDDDVLRRRLSRVGLAPKVLRRRPDGDELDIEALTDFFVDVHSGYAPPEHVYLDRRNQSRDLGVLILLDASGSVTDTDPEGLAVHDHQRRAAATMAVTLEQLGDRVAVYAFRSQGRHDVDLPAIKTFDQRFGALQRARLNQLQPSGYTRLGAAIRGAGTILKNEAGTSNRLLVTLSDGFPYDHDYEGRYAEADARKALEELRIDGLACLSLAIGTDTAADELERVFGSAYASASTLAELSPRMDDLFLSALRELRAPSPRRQ